MTGGLGDSFGVLYRDSYEMLAGRIGARGDYWRIMSPLWSRFTPQLSAQLPLGLRSWT